MEGNDGTKYTMSTTVPRYSGRLQRYYSHDGNKRGRATAVHNRMKGYDGTEAMNDTMVQNSMKDSMVENVTRATMVPTVTRVTTVLNSMKVTMVKRLWRTTSTKLVSRGR